MPAFSPGEYLDGRPPIAASATQVAVPVFVTSARNADEIADARGTLAAVRTAHETQLVPTSSIHGSSTLIAARNPAGAAGHWAAVRAFLTRLAP